MGKQLIEEIVAFGHPNVQASHPTTLMITRDTDLSKQGNCVVAVGADKAVSDLSGEFKSRLKGSGSKLTVVIEADGVIEQVNAYGSPKLSLMHRADLVVRKSDFTSDRTLAVRADKSSSELSRRLIDKLRVTGQKVKVTLILT